MYFLVILSESPSLTKQNITSFYKLIAGTYFGNKTAIAYTHITITVTREDSVGNEYGYIKSHITYNVCVRINTYIPVTLEQNKWEYCYNYNIKKMYIHLYTKQHTHHIN